jgi:hypothetical protein
MAVVFYHRRQVYMNNGYIVYMNLKRAISTELHTACAAYRMHSCCNPLLHDMLHLTASAVSRIEPVVSRLQAAAAEVAVAKLLLVCLCCMTLCWVFSLPTTIPRYCVGGGSTCIESYTQTDHETQHSHLELLSCCHNPNDVWQGCTVQCDIAGGFAFPPQ